MGAPLPPGRQRFVLLADGAQAPMHAVDLPPAVRGTARLRIARRQLVDRIGASAETLELHPLPAPDGAWTRVVALGAETAAAWRRDSGAADLRCAALLPDYLALPSAPGLVVLVAEGGRLRVRVGVDDGFSAPAALAGPLLSAALAAGGLTHVHVTGAIPPEVRQVIDAAGLGAVRDLPAEARPSPGPDLRLDAGQLGARLETRLRAWLAVAALLLAALGLWSTALILETRALEAEAGRLGAETTDLLRHRLIPAGPILDARVQVTRRLEEAAGAPASGADGLDLLARAAPVLTDSDVEVRSLSHAATTGLSVTLVAADFAALEAVAGALRAAGLAVTTGSARSVEDGVEATLAVEAGP
jgi:general secretion pathway protein L